MPERPDASRPVGITGAAGLFGSILRRHWGDRYRLRLVDVAAVDGLAPHEDYVDADITDLDCLEAACAGVDTLVHLAAYPGDGAPSDDVLLRLNVLGAYNAFEAARRAGCRRLVFASSIDVVRGWWHEGPVGVEAPVFPTNLYGATKCWGEALGRVYASAHGLSCLVVRLCNPHFDQAGAWQPDDLISGISPRDAAKLLARCVDAADVDFAVVNGISRHRRGVLDWQVSRRVLGFVPADGSWYPRRVPGSHDGAPPAGAAPAGAATLDGRAGRTDG